MRVHIPVPARFATVAMMLGALACGGNSANEDENQPSPETATVQRDSTDTSTVQNPPGYRGMERDTTIFPPAHDTVTTDTVSANPSPTPPSSSQPTGDTTGMQHADGASQWPKDSTGQ